MYSSPVSILLVAALCRLAFASPTPRPHPVAVPNPETTPFRVAQVPTKTIIVRRDVIGQVESDVASLFSKLGTAVPAFVKSGIPNPFAAVPTGDAVASSLGIDDTQLQAIPTDVIMLGPYANWTDQGWNVRFHGNVYKRPNKTVEKLNSLANIFLIGVDIQNLPMDEQNNARNLTNSIFVIQQKNATVRVDIDPAPSSGSSGEPGGGGAVTPPGGTQNITMPYRTTREGDFDAFVQIDGKGLLAGNETQLIQRLNVHAKGAPTGNATAFLVPPTGYTVISDIDDILRITKIYLPKEGILNSFAKPFMPWENMPEIYANWSNSVSNIHFHYLTTTPIQATRPYESFIYSNYPGGSFDTRPLNFSDIKATLSIRKFLLEKVINTFPGRRFVLVADTSNSDVMRDYPALFHEYPERIACILLRNTTATDKDLFPYNTKGFKGIPQKNYMFFLHPNDLTNIDIFGGNCWNSTVKQNVTFGLQDERLGIHGSDSTQVRAWSWAGYMALLTFSFIVFS